VVLGLQNPNLYERPARFGWSQRARLRVLLAAARACARRAAALVFVSEPFRRTAAAALGPLRAPQSVVEPGLDPIFHAPPGDGFDELRPYVLSVSDFYPYKNFASLVQAFARLGRPDLRLVIAGRPLDAGSVRETREAARAAGVAARVELLGAVRFERMPALYARAECFAFPSLLESFGFPPLEAMACGTPVACSSASVMPAVCGDGPLYFDPLDPADIAAAIARVLDDEPLRARLREAGRARAAAFDWSRSGRLLVEVLASTAARRGG
jgi:glycosyltransferase involved in cell wall biosynthesis